MAAAATQFTAKIGDEHFRTGSSTKAVQAASGVTTRVLNLSEPDNTDDIEVIFLESTVTTKEQALNLLKAVELNILQNDWPV